MNKLWAHLLCTKMSLTELATLRFCHRFTFRKVSL